MPWATDADFNKARKYFAISCVDLAVVTRSGFVLVKRENEPYKGFWHLPGGIIHKGQTMLEKANEVAKRELECTIEMIEFIGVFENLNAYRHDISHCFLAKPSNCTDDFSNLNNVKIFRNNPSKMIPYHKKIITSIKNSNGLLLPIRT